MKRTITAAMLCIASMCAMADESSHAIEICTDKIVINTDSLNMPKSTTAYEVLTLLPDLVERNKEFVLENYTIQINGKTVGSARDAVLNQIRISDLRCIEVSENSFSAISALGEGGSISLELRDAQKEFTASVNTEVTTEANYAGGLRLDKSNGKWSYHNIATIENYVPDIFKSNSTNGLQQDNKQRDFTEYVSTFIDFKPTKNDLLKFHASEVYTNSRSLIDMVYDSESTSESSRTKNIDVFAAVNYEHSLNAGGKLCMEVNYRYVPEKNNKHYSYTPDEETTATPSSDRQDYNYNHQEHNIYGELKLEQPLMKATTTTSAKMELGAQYSYSFADNTSKGNEIEGNDVRNVVLSTLEDTYFLRPYFKIEAKYNKWQFMGNVDYQHFSYQTELKNYDTQGTTIEYLANNPDLNKANHKREDFTGQLVAIFTPNKYNMLRLRFIRSINRPSATQLFPYNYINPDINLSKLEYIGNPELKPSKQNAIDLDYCLNLSTNDYHLELKASTEYSHTYDGIHVFSDNNKRISFYNMEITNVIMGDLGIYFRKGVFSAWFSGNIYHNHENLQYPDTYSGEHKSNYTYYNLLLRPVVNLNHGWMLAANITYNSPITQDLVVQGHRFFGGLRFGKTWKHFNVYIYGNQNFSGKVRTSTVTEKENYTEQEYMHSTIGVGMRYNL